ncbi:MAG: hypothetical protein AAGA92_02970 [Planctomycetota bacterium]
MSPSETLLAIAAAIYLSECAQWALTGSTVFAAFSPGRFRPVRVGLFRNDSGSLIWASPLPPLEPGYATGEWPLALSPLGVAAIEDPTIFFEWSAVQRVGLTDTSLLLNDRPVATASSKEQGEALRRLLLRVARCPEGERPRVVEAAIGRHTSRTRIARRLRCFRHRASWLQSFCCCLLLHFFAAFGLLIWYPPSRPRWPVMLAALLAFWAACFWSYRRAYRRMHPRRPSGWRKKGITLALSPLAAMRAYDALGRPVFGQSHPLAAASVFCEPEVFSQLAIETLSLLQHRPMSEQTHTQGTEVLRWYHGRLQAALCVMLEESGTDAAGLLSPPLPEGDDCVSYCPRCRTQFRSGYDVCVPCGGMALQPLG